MQLIRHLMAILCSLAILSFSHASADDTLFYACESCHEKDGSGNEAVGAPAIAGMDADYVTVQMQKFRDGVRGASMDDLPGRQMNLIASLITDDAEIGAIADYVAAMAPTKPIPTIDADKDSAASIFAQCAACHGRNGEGNKALAAPAITGLNDWYVRSQLTRFRDGVRGAHAEDFSGAQMKAAVASLSDDDILVLAAFVAALGHD